MLNGKTAVVTGGSRGIGEAIVYKLASMGANIAVIYAGNAAAAEKVCKKCGQRYSVEARAYQCNVADFSAVKEASQTLFNFSVHLLQFIPRFSKKFQHFLQELGIRVK